MTGSGIIVAEFGEVAVVVNLHAGHCDLSAPRPGRSGLVTRQRMILDQDEIEGARIAQLHRPASDVVAKDIVRALKFAAEHLDAHRQRGRA